jgi:hypothetical protein
MGWIGDIHQVEYALGIVGADRDEDGKFFIYNDAPCLFLGIGPECVVSDESSYSVGGQRCSLAGLMNSTSYGSGVEVIS